MARAWLPQLLADVEQRLGDGQSHAQIESELAAEFDIPARRVRRYVAEVLRALGEKWLHRDPDDTKAELAGMYLGRYRAAVQRGHDKTALACLDGLAKLLGFAGPAAAVQVMNVIDASGALTSADAIKARLAELKARQLTTGGDDGGA